MTLNKDQITKIVGIVMMSGLFGYVYVVYFWMPTAKKIAENAKKVEEIQNDIDKAKAAKAKCKNEFKAALARTGYSLADIRAFVAERPALRRPLQQVAETEGVVGRAANFVLHVARLMDREPAWTARRMRPAAA